MASQATRHRATSAVFDLMEALRAALSPQDALVLVALMVVWIRKPPSPETGAKLASLHQPDGRLSRADWGQVLGEILFQPERTQAEVALLNDAESIRYERVDEKLLRMLVLKLRHALSTAKRDLAEALIQWRADVVDRGLIATPREIARTMLSLAGTSEGDEIYCVGFGAQSIAIECMRQRRVPILVCGERPDAAFLYSLVADAPLAHVAHDALSLEAEKYFKSHGRRITVAVPPIGLKVADTDAWGFRRSQLGLRSADGLTLEAIEEVIATRAVVLVPNGFLSRLGSEQRLREHLIEEGRLHGVVSFPSGLLSGTSMPFSLLILDLETTTKRVFVHEIDATEGLNTVPGMLKHRGRRFTGEAELLAAFRSAQSDTRRGVDRHAIAAVDYNLNTNRYLVPTAEPTRNSRSDARKPRPVVPFGVLVTIVKPQAFRSQDKDGVLIGEVSPGELPEWDFLTAPARFRQTDAGELQRFESQRLRRDDVLLSTKGTIGRTGIARPDAQHGPISPSQSISILRVNPDGPISDPIVLLMLVRSPYFQTLLRSRVVGSTIPNVPLTDLRALPVRVPTAEEQGKLRQVFEAQRDRQRQIDGLQEKQQEDARRVWALVQLESKGGT